MILQSYVDDSSSNEGIRNFVLAGYVLDAKAWIDFSDEWDKALKARPSITHLHMVDAHALRGEFAGWPPNDRDEKLIKLGKIIQKYQPMSLEVSVSQGELDRYYKPIAPYNLQNPYHLCFYGVILGLARLHKLYGITSPVDFIFDEQGGLGNDVVKWYYEYKTAYPELKNLLGSTPVFRDDRKVLPLQAADMLAWHIRRELERGDEGLAANPYVRVDGRHFITRFDRHMLQDMADKMSKVPGIETVRDKRTWKKMKRGIHYRLDHRLGPPRVLNKFERLIHRIRAGFFGFFLRVLNGLQNAIKRLQ